jgi:hypothetical protein
MTGEAQMDAPELFELELHGGGVERRFRRARPHGDEMPWGTLDLSGLSPEQVLAARCGWTDLAVQEYAAAASQANVLRMLVRARAPLDLSALLAMFPLDELAHTDLCARMAAELGGAVPIEYHAADVFPEPGTDGGSALLAAARAVAWEFCVGETLSHGLLTFHHRHAKEPLLRAVWGRLAKDEAAHARFGWVFLRWAIPNMSASELEALSAEVDRAIAKVDALNEKVARQPSEAFCSVGVFGPQGKDAYLGRTHAILETMIVRRLRSVLRASAS